MQARRASQHTGIVVLLFLWSHMQINQRNEAVKRDNRAKTIQVVMLICLMEGSRHW